MTDEQRREIREWADKATPPRKLFRCGHEFAANKFYAHLIFFSLVSCPKCGNAVESRKHAGACDVEYVEHPVMRPCNCWKSQALAALEGK